VRELPTCIGPILAAPSLRVVDEFAEGETLGLPVGSRRRVDGVNMLVFADD